MTADLLEDVGIEPAVSGVDTIVHLAGGSKGDAEATWNLVRAAPHASTPHLGLHLGHRGGPDGMMPDLVGPRVYTLAEQIRGYLRVRGKHRLMVPG